MEYRSYMHIERIQREEVEGILQGSCYIFPKIDGTNGVVYLGDDGKVHAGSRKRELDVERGLDNQGFMAHVLEDDKIKAYLEDHNDHYIYGEWLVKHSLKYYRDDAWRHFYIFDVYDATDHRYLTYEEYTKALNDYDIKDVIPLMAKLESPTQEELEKLIFDNHYLIDEEDKIGEGIVIKNYGFRNAYGREVFAKIVAGEFLKTKKELKQKNHETKNSEDLSERIVYDLLTEEMIEKEYQKLLEEMKPEEDRSKFIGIFLYRIWHTFLIEEIAHIDKKYNHPKLDLRTLRFEVNEKVKEVKSKLF